MSDTTEQSESVVPDEPPVTEHGQLEPLDGPGHPRLVIIGVLLLLALFALAAAGLGNSLDSEGAEEVAVVIVPRAAGRPAAEVQSQLERLGLYVEIGYASNEVTPADTVTAQMPIAGSRIEVGKLVTLTVSDGPAGVKVPDAAGFQPIAATDLLRVVGLEATTEEVFDETVRVGEVVASDPEFGSRTPLGTTVVLKVSKGPVPRVVPELVGVDESRGFSRIGRAELQIGKIERKTDADAAPGTILSSSPAVGAEVPRSTPVNLVISKAPAIIEMPDFVLMTEKSASSVASDLGLKATFTTVPVGPGDTRDGIVLSQAPIAGAIVGPGSAVELSVGE